MKQMTITPPEGYEVDREKSTFETIVFKEIENKPSPHEFLTKWLNENRLKLRAELGKDRIVWYRDEQWIFDADLKNKTFWYYYHEFWLELYREYSLSHEQIKSVIKDVLLKPFNCEGFTPRTPGYNTPAVLLKPFNCEGFTPKHLIFGEPK